MAKEVVKVKRNGSTLEGLCEGVTLVFKDRAEKVIEVGSDQSLITLRMEISKSVEKKIIIQKIRYYVSEERKLYPRSVGEIYSTHSLGDFHF